MVKCSIRINLLNLYLVWGKCEERHDLVINHVVVNHKTALINVITVKRLALVFLVQYLVRMLTVNLQFAIFVYLYLLSELNELIFIWKHYQLGGSGNLLRSVYVSLIHDESNRFAMLLIASANFCSDFLDVLFLSVCVRNSVLCSF